MRMWWKTLKGTSRCILTFALKNTARVDISTLQPNQHLIKRKLLITKIIMSIYVYVHSLGKKNITSYSILKFRCLSIIRIPKY